MKFWQNHGGLDKNVMKNADVKKLCLAIFEEFPMIYISIIFCDCSISLSIVTRNATRYDNCDDLFHHSFTLKISIFSVAYI